MFQPNLYVALTELPEDRRERAEKMLAALRSQTKDEHLDFIGDPYAKLAAEAGVDLLNARLVVGVWNNGRFGIELPEKVNANN